MRSGIRTGSAPRRHSTSTSARCGRSSGTPRHRRDTSTPPEGSASASLRRKSWAAAPGRPQVRRRPLSLRTKLVLSAAYLLLVILVALEIPLALSVQHRSVSEFGAIELGYAGLLSSQIADDVARASELVAEPPHPGQRLSSAVREVQAARPGVRILVIDAHRRDGAARRRGP